MTPAARLAFDEVLRNMRSTLLRTAAIAGVTALVGATVAMLSISELGKISALDQQQYRAGSSAFQVVSPGGARTNAQRCNEIRGISGVVSAGGVMSVASVRLQVQPDAEVNLERVTPGFIAAAWPDLANSSSISVLAGPDFSDLAWEKHTRVMFSGANGAMTTLRLDAVPRSRSMVGLDGAILEVAPPSGTVDTCLVLARPSARSAVGRAISGWFGRGTSVQDVLLPSRLVQSPQTLLSSRISQFGWLAGGIVVALVLLGGWLARRADFALYRLLGFSESSVLTMFVVETALLALAPVQLGAAASIGFSRLDSLIATAFWLDWIRLDLIIVLLPLVGLLLVPKRSLLSTLKGS